MYYYTRQHGAIKRSATANRNSVQTPVYFVSKALKKTEVNYSAMEKLVLAPTDVLGEYVAKEDTCSIPRQDQVTNPSFDRFTLRQVLKREDSSFSLWLETTFTKMDQGQKAVAQITEARHTSRNWNGQLFVHRGVNVATNDDERRRDLDLWRKDQRAAICEAKAKSKMKGYYVAKVRGVSFRPGDFVYRANDASHAEDARKLGPKSEGPYEVTEALGKGAYKLRDIDGREFPRTWNICNLKRCYL
ncbi:hypothetical protein Tco_0375419 [Tanacetum coccineum]